MNFRQVGKKIKSVGNIKKITKAMQMVAAVKMKKAQVTAVQGKPYRELLQSMLARVSDQGVNEFVKKDDKEYSKKNLYIVVTSNKGLCGSYNFNVVKQAVKETDFNNSTFVTMGKKGAVMISKLGGTVTADFSEHTPFTTSVSAVFDLVSKAFLSGEYGKISLIYNKFISTFKQVPSIEPLLPISKEELLAIKTTGNEEYVIEPDKNLILSRLINDYVKEKITGAILDSKASEESSRMMAMKSATDNAGEIIFGLTLLKNKLRQASITNELLDITTAKEAAGA